MMNKLLISGGRIIDAADSFDLIGELLVSNKKIAECSAKITKPASAQVIDASGKLVIPGLVDPHIHVSGDEPGYFMLARAGVTTALDLCGFSEEIIPYLQSSATGLTLGFLFPLSPGRTVSGTNPDKNELRKVIEKALNNKAFGIKIISGHYPLTPEAQHKAIEICNELNCHCAVHAGSTEKGSNIEGLEELAELAGDLPVQVAHVNSYCRGQITGNPIEEAGRALNVLKSMPNACSESYLDVMNGTSGRIENGVPLSNVTKNCLKAGGYQVSAAGLENAVKSGWARVNGIRGKEIVLLPPVEGYEHFKAKNSDVMLSFAVNSPGAAIGIATAQSGGRFIVNALSTDGGKIPRNTTLAKALPLVRFGAFSLLEFVEKACLAPAKMLKLENKGRLSVGADADITIVDPDTARAEYVISGGQIVYHADKFFEVPGTLFSYDGRGN
ncbi:MAG: amidohydrolase family protein [Victivallaceae bacterium]|nr:amidohydrolase family protein [Victivallaceae bacterium]